MIWTTFNLKRWKKAEEEVGKLIDWDGFEYNLPTNVIGVKARDFVSFENQQVGLCHLATIQTRVAICENFAVPMAIKKSTVFLNTPLQPFPRARGHAAG